MPSKGKPSIATANSSPPTSSTAAPVSPKAASNSPTAPGSATVLTASARPRPAAAAAARGGRASYSSSSSSSNSAGSGGSKNSDGKRPVRRARPSASQSQSESQSQSNSGRSIAGHQHQVSNSFNRFNIRPSVSESGTISDLGLGGSLANSADNSRRQSLNANNNNEQKGIILSDSVTLSPVDELKNPPTGDPIHRRHSSITSPTIVNSAAAVQSVSVNGRINRTLSVTAKSGTKLESATINNPVSSAIMNPSNADQTNPTHSTSASASPSTSISLANSSSPSSSAVATKTQRKISQTPAIPTVTTSGGLQPSILNRRDETGSHPPPPNHRPPPRPSAAAAVGIPDNRQSIAMPSHPPPRVPGNNPKSAANSSSASQSQPQSNPASLKSPTQQQPHSTVPPQTATTTVAVAAAATPNPAVLTPSSTVSPSSSATPAASATSSSSPATVATVVAVAAPVSSSLSGLSKSTDSASAPAASNSTRKNPRKTSISQNSLAAPSHRRSNSSTPQSASPRSLSPNPGTNNRKSTAAESTNSAIHRKNSIAAIKGGATGKRSSSSAKTPDSAPTAAASELANSSESVADSNSAASTEPPRSRHSAVRRLGYYDQLFLKNTGLSESDPIAAISLMSGSLAFKEAAAVAREKESQAQSASASAASGGDVTYVVDNDWNVDLEIIAREASMSAIQRAKSIAIARREIGSVSVAPKNKFKPQLIRPATLSNTSTAPITAALLSSSLGALSEDDGDEAQRPNGKWFDDSDSDNSSEEESTKVETQPMSLIPEPEPVDLSFLGKDKIPQRPHALSSDEGGGSPNSADSADYSTVRSAAHADSVFRSRSISNLTKGFGGQRSSLTVRVGKSSSPNGSEGKSSNLISLFKQAFDSVTSGNNKKSSGSAAAAPLSPRESPAPQLLRATTSLSIQPSKSPQSAPGISQKSPREPSEALSTRPKLLPARSLLHVPNGQQNAPPSPGGGRNRRMERRRSSSVHMFGRRGSEMGDMGGNRFKKENNDPAIVNSMATYVPRMVLNRLTKCGNIGIRNNLTAADQLQEMASSKARARLGIGVSNHQAESYTLRNAAILIADVSGFTRLNEMLANRDAVHAAETMTVHLNRYFSSILDIIDSHNGDCVKFAGDALIVIFAAPTIDESKSTSIQVAEKKSHQIAHTPKLNKLMLSGALDTLHEGDDSIRLTANPALSAPKEFSLALADESSGQLSPRQASLSVDHPASRSHLSPRLSSIFSAVDSSTEFIDDILAANASLVELRNLIFDSVDLICTHTSTEGIVFPLSIAGARLIDFLIQAGKAESRVDAIKSANLLFNIGMRDCSNPFGLAADRKVTDSPNKFYSFACTVRKEEISKVLEKLEDRRAGAVASMTAVQCGLALQQKVGVYKVDDVELSLHIAVAGGNVFAMHLGGVENELEFVLAGQPFSQLANGLEASGSGDVVVSADTWDAIHHFCQGKLVTESHKSKAPIATGEVLIKRVCTPIPVLMPSSEQIAIQAVKQLAIGTALRSYVPRSALIKLDVGQDQWMAELRTASIIFVNLHGLSMNTRNSHDPTRPDQILKAMQKIIQHNRGYRRQFLCDDKGTTLIVVFGVPPAAHEDDAIRSVKTALELREKLLSLDVAHSIGIASGNVYVGSVGSTKRQEHAVVGDVVNLAARLSVHKSDLGIVVDKYTWLAASSKINFQSMGEIKVKGKANSIKIFHPVMVNKIANIDASGQILGRRNETMTFMEELVKLQKPPRSSSKADILNSRAPIVWIEGSAGVGKSCLARNFYRLAKVNLPTIFIAAEATERSRGLAIWVPILDEIIGLTKDMTSDARHEKVLKFAKVSLKPKHQPLLPLLNDILNLKLPDNKVIAKLKSGGPEKENHGFSELLIRIVKAHQNEKYQSISSVSANSNKDKKFVKPMCWIIEDVHNVDSASLNQLISVWESKKTRILMLFTSRNISLAERSSSVYQRLKNLNNPPMVFIPLGGLDAENVTRLVSQRLQVPQLPTVLAELIHSKAKGNPLYAVEVAEALKESGYFDVKHGQIIMNDSMENKEMAIPSSLKSLLIRRIDRLPPKDILVCKLASVFGQQFNRSALLVLFEKEGGMSNEINGCLADLEAAQIIENRGLGVYAFLHSMVQQACYELLLLSQRSRLHLTIAEWYEKQGVAIGAIQPIVQHKLSISSDDDKSDSPDSGSPASTRSLSGSSAPATASPPNESNPAALRPISELRILTNQSESKPIGGMVNFSLPSGGSTPSNKSLITGGNFTSMMPGGSMGMPQHLIAQSIASTAQTSASGSSTKSSVSSLDIDAAIKSGILCPGETFNGVLFTHFAQALKQPENLELSTVVKGFSYLDALYLLAAKNGDIKEGFHLIEKSEEIWKSLKGEHQTLLMNSYPLEILRIIKGNQK